MSSIGQIINAVTRAINDGETEVMLLIPGIDASGMFQRLARADGSVSLDYECKDSPLGVAVHAVEVWAAFKVADVVAWLKRQEVEMSTVRTYDHCGVAITLFKMKGKYGFTIGSSKQKTKGFASLKAAQTAAEARAAELSGSNVRGAA